MDKARKLLGLATIVESDDLYQQLVDAGVEVDNHESDLYVKVTPESEKIIANSRFKGAAKFKSERDGGMWFDIPFAFTPFWDKKQKNSEPRIAGNEPKIFKNY